MSEQLVADDSRYLVGTYRRRPLTLVRGEGPWLFDDQDRRFLDFMSGIAVMALGHSDPEWVAALTEQAGRLAHVSNLYYTEPQVTLARLLVEGSFADRVFFCNSGAEANEAALKMARRWGRAVAGPHKHRVVAFEGGFHGRTVGALSVTHQPVYREPFAPLMGGVDFAPFNDPAVAADLIGPETCAVMVEPVQGEGGVRPADQAFVEVLRDQCRQHQALLIFDEVQCGLGRTGTLWAHEALGVTPDVMTLAKPLAGGLPIGAALVTEEVAAVMRPGDHGSTFGAGPLACRVAEVLFRRLSAPDFLQALQAKADRWWQALNSLQGPLLRERRGRGFLVGLELTCPAQDLVEAAEQRGLLVITAGSQTVRLAPPLTLDDSLLKQGVDTLQDCLDALSRTS